MFAVVAAALTTAQPLADEVTALPGWSGALPSKQYSGYLDVPGAKGLSKHYHYWFVEAEAPIDPLAAATPTILWLNGGPGCSSLDGFIYENGPFLTNASDPTKLVKSPQAWTQLANVIWLESPVGVGYSYSDEAEDYKCTDDTTAADGLAALEAFFKAFPIHQKQDFYITGESYGGVYVPTLAEAIVQATLNGTYGGAPLVGIAVGNGCTGSEIGTCGGQRDEYMTEYLLGLAFIPRTLKTQVRAECDFTKSPPYSIKCEALIAEIHATVGKVNLYNVYGNCISGDGGEATATAEVNGKIRTLLSAPLGPTTLYADGLGTGGPDACIDSRRASAYLNQPEVIAAIHVKALKPGKRWATCGSADGWAYKSTRANLPRDTYPFLIKNIRVVIYNGDWDSCVPYPDNEAWTSGMGFPLATSGGAWHAWSYNCSDDGSAQVAGYATNYDVGAAPGFSFVTVKGGRHEVPETAPGQALELITRLTQGIVF